MTTYILVNRVPVPEPDLRTWAQWFEHADRKVEQTHLPSGAVVSTVFLGIDHQFSDHDAPILFETMVFSEDPHNENSWRYSTWKDAVEGHTRVVQMLTT